MRTSPGDDTFVFSIFLLLEPMLVHVHATSFFFLPHRGLILMAVHACLYDASSLFVH